MTLITNVYLKKLWEDAQANPSSEHHSISFWNYLLSKVVFASEGFIVDHQKPPSLDDPNRKIDIVVKYFEDPDFKIKMLCFHEAKKPKATKYDIEIVESQAIDACETYCKGEGKDFIYAMTTIGTAARQWRYESGGFEPLFGPGDLADRSAYIEASSPDASQIRAGFEYMKKFPPSLRVGQSYAQLGQSHPINAPAASIVPE
ncbi:hypothetical protein AOQ84DRAFT_219697 [Glonium stellatum]|uniref:Uncharacterized protein n=1 Tax=Glonium stellatum TaxID=574774 RepID=A0A8E2F5H0_9PEZI|nr:hypothetical protein AOQ84DRAFT_219697 [Glonium stellatum]